MPMKKLLAKGLYRLAEGTLKEFRHEHNVRSDLGPVFLRLAEIERRMMPPWVGYAILGMTFLLLAVGIWILVRTY
jgi:hypothetical protein